MFYQIFMPLINTKLFGYYIFNVFQYVTFRSVGAFITALIFSLFLGPFWIKKIKNFQAVEIIDEYMPESHKKKTGTPTMGGLIILSGLLISTFLWNNLSNSYIILMIITTVWLGGVGFLDDYLKNIKRSKDGLIAKYKLIFQLFLGLGISLYLYISNPDIAKISVPFLKNVVLNLGWLFIPFVVFLIVGASNAVNLTDGLDGLAAGTMAFAIFGIGVFAYIKGNFKIANYLNLEYINNSGELVIYISAIIGTLVGFLWFNTKPAEIFMGDTGSLAMGGIIAVLAVLIKEELVLGILGGIFVVEALSSLLQRYYFKYTRLKFGEGRRLFKMAPLHHHFEKLGMKEEKIVVRFWIIATLLLALGLATIKLR